MTNKILHFIIAGLFFCFHAFSQNDLVEGYYLTYEGDTIRAQFNLYQGLSMRSLLEKDFRTTSKVSGIHQDGKKFSCKAGMIPSFVISGTTFLCVAEGDSRFLPKRYVKSTKYTFFKVFKTGFYDLMYSVGTSSAPIPGGVGGMGGMGAVGVMGGGTIASYVICYVKNQVGDFMVSSEPEKTLKILFQDDPIVLHFLKEFSKKAKLLTTYNYRLTPDDVQDLFERYNYHKETGKLRPDEHSIEPYYPEEITKPFVNDTAIHDMVTSSLESKVWDSELITLRRTIYSNTKDLLVCGKTALLSHKKAETELRKLQSKFESGEIGIADRSTLEEISNSLNLLELLVPSMDTGYYRNELEFYKRQLVK